MSTTRHFWDDLSNKGNAVALIDGDTEEVVTFRALDVKVERAAEFFRRYARETVLLPLDNTILDISRYLAALRACLIPILYSSRTSPSGLVQLVKGYSPRLVCGNPDVLKEIGSFQYQEDKKIEGCVVRDASVLECFPNPTLNLMLSTSGSTGSSKLVRLSAAAIESNAMQVCGALKIGPTDRAVTSIPLSYVYGLSVLHSHLLAGASLLVQSRSVVEKDFWHRLRSQKVTSFAGVPWTYGLLRSAGLRREDMPTVTNCTTSGGAVDQKTVNWIENEFQEEHMKFYYMYGQTEAAGRMTVLPSDMRRLKPGSVGLPIQGSRVWCRGDASIVFSGPSVMLGYCNTSADISRGDDLNGTLETGDIGSIDADGYLYLSGRKSRLCKVYGIRLSLDEVQECFLRFGDEVVVTQSDDGSGLVVTHSCEDEFTVRDNSMAVAQLLNIPRVAISTRRITSLTRTLSGKLTIVNN